MPQLSQSDYDILDEFVLTAIKRVAEGKSAVLDAHLAVMHALTAWDKGATQEFIPWIEATREEWAKDNA